MKIKGIYYGETTLSPFKATVLSAPTCKIKCKGCNSRALKKLPDIEISIDEIFERVFSAEDEGIVFSGLEWSESPLELLELCRECSKRNLKVMIYTGLDFLDFFVTLGKSVYSTTKTKGLFEMGIINENDPNFYAIIGKSMLDAYVPNDYYLKVGSYKRELPSFVDEIYEITLTSSNQTIILIKSDKESIK